MTTLSRPITAAMLLVASYIFSGSAISQVDVGFGASGYHVVYQNYQSVGFIWVKKTDDPCRYTEYWYLSPDYVYPGSPGPGETIQTVIQFDASVPEFKTPKQFFRYARSILPLGKRIITPVYELGNCGPDGFSLSDS